MSEPKIIVFRGDTYFVEKKFADYEDEHREKNEPEHVISSNFKCIECTSILEVKRKHTSLISNMNPCKFYYNFICPVCKHNNTISQCFKAKAKPKLKAKPDPEKVYELYKNSELFTDVEEAAKEGYYGLRVINDEFPFLKDLTQLGFEISWGGVDFLMVDWENATDGEALRLLKICAKQL